MPGSRLSRGFVSLAASAITAIYVAGYVHTDAADATLNLSSVATPPAAAAMADPTQPIPGPTVAIALPSSTLAAARSAPITDQAVEQFADARHISWDEARSQMEAAAGGRTPTATATLQVAQAVGTATDTARPQAAAPMATSTPARPTVTPTTVVRAAPPAPTRTSVPAVVSSTFKDGSFSGRGTSRRGDIQVAVVVQSGRVASVTITGATTQYPTRLIAGLPAQVVSRQSAQVDTVSGATYSSLAFRGAVQQALQQAHG